MRISIVLLLLLVSYPLYAATVSLIVKPISNLKTDNNMLIINNNSFYFKLVSDKDITLTPIQFSQAESVYSPIKTKENGKTVYIFSGHSEAFVDKHYLMVGDIKNANFELKDEE